MGPIGALIPSIIGVGASLLGGKSVTGGSSQQSNSSSTSFNQALPMLNDQFGSVTGQTAWGADALRKLLVGDTSGFDSYKQGTGFDNALATGLNGVTASGAANGLLRSGGLAKSLGKYTTGLQNQYAGTYMDNLMRLNNLGINAGQLIGGAGNYSSGTGTSSGSSTPGISGLLGGLLGGIAGA